MALLLNSAEAGVAPGTVVDATNSDAGGDAFTVFAAAPTITYVSTAPRGSLGIQVAAAASASTYFSWQAVAGATNAMALSFYLYLPALPGTSSQPIVSVRSSGGGTGLFNLQLQASTGKLFITSDAAAGATQGAVAATGLSPSTWYRVELQATNNSTTTTDTFTVRVYLGDSTVEQTALGTSSTAANLGTSTMGTVRFGRPAGIAQAFTAIIKQLGFRTGSNALIGPAAANAAPIVNAGADQSVAGGTLVTLTGTDTDTDSAIATRQWAQTSGPAVTLSGADTSTTTFVPSTPGTYVFSYTVTDSVGTAGSDSVTVTVTAATPNTAPTVGAGPDQPAVEPWDTVTLTATEADSDGTIASRVWSQTAGTPTVTLSGTGLTRTFEAPGTVAGTTLTFQFSATDDDGATGTDTMTVAVLPVTERAVIGGIEVPMRVTDV